MHFKFTLKTQFWSYTHVRQSQIHFASPLEMVKSLFLDGQILIFQPGSRCFPQTILWYPQIFWLKPTFTQHFAAVQRIMNFLPRLPARRTTWQGMALPRPLSWRAPSLEKAVRRSGAGNLGRSGNFWEQWDFIGEIVFLNGELIGGLEHFFFP